MGYGYGRKGKPPSVRPGGWTQSRVMTWPGEGVRRAAEDGPRGDVRVGAGSAGHPQAGEHHGPGQGARPTLGARATGVEEESARNR